MKHGRIKATVCSLAPWLAVVVLLSVLGLVAGSFSWPTATRQVSGTVASYRRSESEGRGTPLLIVELTSGPTIRVPIGENVPVRYGKRVTLTEIETALFGLRRYRFVRYDESDESRTSAWSRRHKTARLTLRRSAVLHNE